jgi:acetolactate synthase I/II/III large subunit
LPIIIVIWCDGDFGMISLKQSMEFGRSAYTQFDNPDFVKLAESFGAVGYKVRSTEEFSTVLGKAKDSKSAPVIIAVDVDYSGNYRLLEGSKDNP